MMLFKNKVVVKYVNKPFCKMLHLSFNLDNLAFNGIPLLHYHLGCHNALHVLTLEGNARVGMVI